MLIRTLEEVSMNAWPALRVQFHDGWVLRFAQGYTRRANSVHPLYAPALDIESKLAHCEARYAAQGLPATFKMTPASQPSDLDALLEARGYALDAPTSVQVLDLSQVALADPTRAAQLSSVLTEGWFSTCCAMSHLAARHVPILRRILEAILPTTCFALLHEGGAPVACGMAVLEGDTVGFFDIVTAEAYRRQGYATQLMLNLIAWSRRCGARTAYLQVMHDNVPALGLYARLGFRERYSYWYRVRYGN